MPELIDRLEREPGVSAVKKAAPGSGHRIELTNEHAQRSVLTFFVEVDEPPLLLALSDRERVGRWTLRVLPRRPVARCTGLFEPRPIQLDGFRCQAARSASGRAGNGLCAPPEAPRRAFEDGARG
jgi:hypothetical protein